MRDAQREINTAESTKTTEETTKSEHSAHFQHLIQILLVSTAELCGEI